MDTGSNKSLYTLIAVVVFGIFLSLSYWMFKDNLNGVLASVMSGTSIMTSKKLDNTGLIPTDERYFTITSAGKITNYDAQGGTRVVIPTTINGITVSSIGGTAFYKKGLTELTLPESLEKIDDGAITFENGVYEYYGAFAYNNIEKIYFPNKVTHIGDYAFCLGKLKEIVFSDSVEYIGYATFSVNDLTKIDLPNNLKTIEGYAFGASKVTEITIPTSVTTLSSQFLIHSKTQIQKINIPKSLNPTMDANYLIKSAVDVDGVRQYVYYDNSVVNYY